MMMGSTYKRRWRHGRLCPNHHECKGFECHQFFDPAFFYKGLAGVSTGTKHCGGEGGASSAVSLFNLILMEGDLNDPKSFRPLSDRVFIPNGVAAAFPNLFSYGDKSTATGCGILTLCNRAGPGGSAWSLNCDNSNIHQVAEGWEYELNIPSEQD